jgi:hypothetical protein
MDKAAPLRMEALLAELCLKELRLSPENRERCYCGTIMTQINTCKYRCPNCGALLDCEDVSGLPK